MAATALTHRHVFVVRPCAPFHFDGTFHKPSHFQNDLKMSDWVPGKWWGAFRSGKKLFGIAATSHGTTAKPTIRFSVYARKRLATAERENIRNEIIWRFELDRNLTEFASHTRKDMRFAPVFRKWIGMRAGGGQTLYELLIIGVVLQNAPVRRSQQMLDALLGAYGTKLRFGGKELYAIWMPEAMRGVPEHELRALKIGYRAKIIKRLSQDFAAGAIDEAQLRHVDGARAKKELMKLYGVGPETARILLFEALHHYDTFDHIAPWQQKIYSRLFYGKPLISAATIRDDIKKRYGAYAMLAVHYIWEDIFWQRAQRKIPWLEREIRF